MDLLDIERKVQKATSLYINDNDPIFMFCYSNIEEADEAFQGLLDVFGEDKIALYIRYNLNIVNVSIISESTAEVVNINNLHLHQPEMFQLIKPISNKINGTDVFSRTYACGLVINAGVITKYGVHLSNLSSGKTGLKNVKKMGTHLIP